MSNTAQKKERKPKVVVIPAPLDERIERYMKQRGMFKRAVVSKGLDIGMSILEGQPQ